MPKVTFEPYQATADAFPAETILEIAMRLGIHINASCGGLGACGKCKVILEKGDVQGEKIDGVYYKACTTVPLSDVVVRIPVESKFDRKALLRKDRILAKAIERKESFALASPLKWRTLVLNPPSLEDNIPDLSRVLHALKADGENFRVELEFIRKLPYVLRAQNFSATFFWYEDLFAGRKVLFDLGKPETKPLGVAIDLGTTTLQLELVDLSTGEVLAQTSDYNPQISFGEDVISRIEFCKKRDGLRILSERVKEKIFTLTEELLRQADRTSSEVKLFSLAGNTVMTHLFLELEPRFLREHPYVPVAQYYPPLLAKELGFSPFLAVFQFSPSVASYVGGDITAGVLASLIAEEDELTLFVDLGTNGEIVVGNRDFLMCAACSAGPAFEGGGIKHGMRATSGAIERVHIDPDTFEPMIITISKVRPKGICGSGIISLLAQLFKVGLIDPSGKFRRDIEHPRLRKGELGYEYVLVFKEESAIDHDIVFTEADIDNLMRAKGAMFAGYQILLESAGLSIFDLNRVFLAGTFGSYIDLEDAVTIGLLPDLPRDKFFFLGNTSLQGAKKAMLSKEKLLELNQITQMMTHVELSAHPRYMDYYMASLFLPHTNEELFPSVKRG